MGYFYCCKSIKEAITIIFIVYKELVHTNKYNMSDNYTAISCMILKVDISYLLSLSINRFICSYSWFLCILLLYFDLVWFLPTLSKPTVYK